jgi:hypothetical protein
MKKDTFYFSHDYNAHNDVKILFMRQQLGMEGYGIYWFLIESLADSGGYLPLKIIPVLSMQMQTTEVKVKAVIESFELFEINDKQFFSARLLKHLDVRTTLSEKGKLGAEKRWKNGGANGVANGVAIGEGNAKERKGKEIKEKEIKDINTPDLKNSNLFRKPNIPTIEQIKYSFFQNGGTDEMADAFFNKHSGTGWFLNGSPIVNYSTLIPNFINNFKKFQTNAKPKSRTEQTASTLNYIKQKGEQLFREIEARKQNPKS